MLSEAPRRSLAEIRALCLMVSLHWEISRVPARALCPLRFIIKV